MIDLKQVTKVFDHRGIAGIHQLDLRRPPSQLAVWSTHSVQSTQTNVNESKGGFQIINEPPTIERLAAALNALGVSTREMMAIFQTLKRSGALQAELVIN